MSLSMISAIMMLFFVLLIFVFIAYILFRKKSYRINAFWLLKNDRKIVGIVSSLSYLSAIRTHRSFISNKRLELIVHLRQTVLSHTPDSAPKDIDKICNDLLVIVERIKKKRSESIYK
jgi:amino acid transporter